MTCLYIIDYSPLFLPLSQFLEPAHTWATSMLMDVTRQPQPMLRSRLLKEHVNNLKLTGSKPSIAHDAKRWLKSVPGRLNPGE